MFKSRSIIRACSIEQKNLLSATGKRYQMKIIPFFKSFFAALTVFGLVMAVYLLWMRPYQLHWGASNEEILQPMPGDELDSSPTFLATRAITIKGTPAQIFPWLVQMGFGRAGYYGFDILENAGSTSGPDSADRIVPALQNFKAGDKVPISTASEMVFYAIQPDQYLIWSGQSGQNPGGFTWALYPLDPTHTRLVSRIRWTHNSILKPGLLSLDIFTDFTDHLAVRKILQGVKGRVEGSNEAAYLTNLEFFSYVFTAMVFFAGLILLLVRPFTRIRWLAGLASGLGWLLTWYAPIPWWGGILLEIPILIGLYPSFRGEGQRNQRAYGLSTSAVKSSQGS
jgi:hypothetical protein